MTAPFRQVLWSVLWFCAASMAQAQDAGQNIGLADRLRALAAPSSPDLYEDERTRDLDLIARHAPALFGAPPARLVMFTGPGCDTCPAITDELQSMADRHGVVIRFLDTSDQRHARLMAALTLDALPSFVMADRMILGPIPVFVLERYLTE
jgi:hypothetical protein